ncbi:MAG: hypothetical protein A3G35_06725 [candidate division NC10 bacterium RIFCSPLOWO2_12_FULL_66_18]|nr:MAG: hypothetical protein A3G35_06725 [candidate division NC10 bacterium RIFCSPLOWO2_12_FULL_66_18]
MVHLGDPGEDLTARQSKLERSALFLEALYRISEGLTRATQEHEVAQLAVDRALELPGVKAAWISLREGEAGFRLAAARGLPPGLAVAGAMEGDCLCRRLLRSGELTRATNIILECERLTRAEGDTGGLRYHASVPLSIDDRTLGVMNLAGPGPGWLPDRDLAILEGVGNQVAIALERARAAGHPEDRVGQRPLALAAETTEGVQTHERVEGLAAVLVATSDFVALCHVDGRVIYFNPAARRILGIAEGEAISSIRITDTHPEWARQLVVGEAIPTAIRDGIWSGDTALLSRTGRVVPVSQVIIAHRVPDGSVEFLSTIARDLSERKRAEEELHRQREVMHHAEKLAAMGQLLAGVAHQLNNPLSVVTGRAALLREAAGGGPLAEQAERIVQAAERCARIVKNFLALARQWPPERAQVDLNKVVTDAVDSLASPLREDSVEVALDLGSDIPTLSADPHQLHQVLVNLISNAHHATLHTAPPRRVTLGTRYDPPRGCVTLTVADSGPGIPPELEGRIFEPFFTTMAPGEGTGLGLALCRGIVEEHRGSITVERPSQGAVVVVTLPVEPFPAAEQKIPGGEVPAALGERAILVVDDEPEVAALLAAILSAAGHHADTASNGVIALEQLGRRNYDLVLSSLRMPQLDGPGFYRELAHRYPHLRRRFVCVTGDALSAEGREFLAQAGVPRLGKPFSREEVLLVVARALRAV